MHRKDEILIFKSIETPAFSFRFEEFWEEDDAGYCVSDYILAKHTRLSVYDKNGCLIRIFDLDSREYDKDMWIEGSTLCVKWHPEYDREQVTRINTSDLSEQ